MTCLGLHYTIFDTGGEDAEHFTLTKQLNSSFFYIENSLDIFGFFRYNIREGSDSK